MTDVHARTEIDAAPELPPGLTRSVRFMETAKAWKIKSKINLQLKGKQKVDLLIISGHFE